MFRYTLRCQHPDCAHEAAYKIAARWSDGLTGELKTYALSCDDHLATLFAESRRRNERTRTLPGEQLEAPGIYLLASGDRDRNLPRLSEEEERLKLDGLSSTDH
jgi:hypothetical protein